MNGEKSQIREKNVDDLLSRLSQTLIVVEAWIDKLTHDNQRPALIKLRLKLQLGCRRRTRRRRWVKARPETSYI